MKHKILSVVLLVFLVSVLTGCVSTTSYAVINPDGSGSITVSAGVTEYGYDMFKDMAYDMGGDTDKEYVPFSYEGKTYYGETKTLDFKNPAEFNYLLNQKRENKVDTGLFELIKKDNGTFTLFLNVTTDTGKTDELRQQLDAELDISKKEIDMLMKDMVVVYEFEFPQNIRMVDGIPYGISIDGRKLKIDFLEMSKYISKDEEFVFSTDIKETGKVFDDVERSHWAFKAIKAMSKSGIINGVGDGKFNPGGYITYSQFAQISARLLGLETGSENGYWAYKAIKSCLEYKFIDNLGPITSANYDKHMNREAAVASIYRLISNNYNAIKIDITKEDIPDFYDITEKYQQDVLMAYNLGITSGIDASRTFDPLEKLTRAQICQMFYNIGLYHAPSNIPEL